MPKICYVEKKFAKSSLAIIAHANGIIEDYLAQGLTLTLRQLYYRFVAADLLPNRQKEYKRLGSIINDGRLAGLIDWNAIEDRGRNLISPSHWTSPEDIVEACAQSYKIDKWKGQDFRVEVWVEKEALIGVIENASRPLDVPCFACKGYTSASEMWRAARRFQRYESRSQTPVIIHLGDHDPSGIDMSRDIRDRLETFGIPMEVDRIALNMNQVDEFDPPPNPAKLTDSRAAGYIAEFGDDSWELDALEPAVLHQLIQKTIKSYMNEKKYKEREARQERERVQLTDVSGYWEDVIERVEELKFDDTDEGED